MNDNKKILLPTTTTTSIDDQGSRSWKQVPVENTTTLLFKPFWVVAYSNHVSTTPFFTTTTRIIAFRVVMRRLGSII